MTVHKDNKDRVESEERRMRSLSRECLDKIEHILNRENLDARIIFYPREARS